MQLTLIFDPFWAVIEEACRGACPAASPEAAVARRYLPPPLANLLGRQFALAAVGAAGAAGEIDSVSHAFQPEGRLRASNSP
jgi:hypothetical protein